MSEDITKAFPACAARLKRRDAARKDLALVNENTILAKLRSEGWAIEPTPSGWVATCSSKT